MAANKYLWGSAAADGFHGCWRPLADTSNSGRIIRFGAGTLLLNAAVLKFMSFPTPWSIPVIVFECLLGAMLIGNFLPRTAWTLAMTAFGVFAAVALWKTVAGEAHCGCLGTAVEVPPHVMFVVDIAILGLLALNRGCKALDSADPLIQRPLFIPVLIGVCLPSASLMYMQHRAELTHVIGEPSAWLGNEFPLQLDTEANDQIQIGRWTVVLIPKRLPDLRTTVCQRRYGAITE